MKAGVRGQPPLPPPTLSLGERDRRWRCTRDLMRANGLDCLIVGGFRGRARYESYITDDYLEGAVVFPREGEPTALTWSRTRVARAAESFSRGVEPWVTDYRVGLSGAATAAVIREKGLERRPIGVVGLGRTSPGEPEGFIPYRFWADLLDELPGATFVDISQAFGDMLLVRSDEELALIRYAARISEAACQAMLEVTRPGVGEETIYAAAAREVFRRGGDLMYPIMSLHSGPHNIAWGPPRWLHRAEPPRRIERGDMVQAEIHACYGGLESQVQMSIAVDPIDEVNRRCEQVARDSYEAGLGALRPGVTFEELVRAMQAPLRESGCWAKTPLAHTFTVGATGFTGVNRQQIEGTEEGRLEGTVTERSRVTRGELVLRPGMTLELEPNACLGAHRVDIGAGVIVTETGCEELNVLPVRVQHVG